MDEFEVKSKLRGYYNLPRQLIVDVYKGMITPDQFVLLLVYIGFADRDSRHPNFAIAYISNRKVSEILRWNKSKVAYNKACLFGKKYIGLKAGENRINKVSIKNPKLYFAKITDPVSKTKSTISRKETTQLS